MLVEREKSKEGEGMVERGEEDIGTMSIDVVLRRSSSRLSN
jgi:hypothetical protein